MIYLDEGFYNPADKNTSQALCELQVVSDVVDEIENDRTIEVRIQLNYIQGNKVLLGQAVTFPVTFTNDADAMGNFMEEAEAWVLRLANDFGFDEMEQHTITSQARLWAFNTLK